MSQLPVTAGREAFGADPASYHRARPPYPEAVYDILRDRCGLAPSCATFEVGAGTGTATARLLELGAGPLVAIEPDRRLADHLRASLPDGGLQVRVEAFEDADLPGAAFDLGVSFTAFHWVDQAAGLAKAARLLKPAGWWVMAWNVFGDPARFDAFHEATGPLLATARRSPSAGQGGVPFALDADARRDDLAAAGGFRPADYDRFDWTLVLDPPAVRRLYATYSEITAMPAAARDALLDTLESLAANQFQGRVERNMVTAVYTARRG